MKTFLKIFIVSFFCFFAAYYIGSFTYLKENNVQLDNNLSIGFAEDTNIKTSILSKLGTKAKPPTIYSSLEDAMEKSSRVNFLVLGLDGERSDTIMVASFSLEEKKINLISIPRDTYVHRKGYNAAELRKVNSIYFSHGIDGVKKTVSYLLEEMPIHHYIILDYEAVEKLVDMVGGVNVDIPMDMNYKDPTSNPPLNINIPKGEQLLDGKNALDFIRYRSGYIDGDLGRLKAQQQFLNAFTTKASKNITTIVMKGFEQVKTDINLLDSLHYGRNLLGMGNEDLDFAVIPGKAEFRNINKKVLSYYIHNPKESKKMLEEIYNVKNKEQ